MNLLQTNDAKIIIYQYIGNKFMTDIQETDIQGTDIQETDNIDPMNCMCCSRCLYNRYGTNNRQNGYKKYHEIHISKIIRPSVCQYVYPHGRGCGELNKSNHIHCPDVECNGCVYCTLCGKCPNCLTGIHIIQTSKL